MDTAITVVQSKGNILSGNRRYFNKEKQFKNMTLLGNGKSVYYSIRNFWDKF
jgi:hypothetical protein